MFKFRIKSISFKFNIPNPLAAELARKSDIRFRPAYVTLGSIIPLYPLRKRNIIVQKIFSFTTTNKNIESFT